MIETIVGMPNVTTDGAYHTLSATLTVAGHAHRAWIRVPGPPEDGLRVEPFLLAAFLPAMRVGGEMIVEAPCSPQLTRGIAEAMRQFSKWYPDLRIVPIRVAEYAPDLGPVRGPVVPFSGGVDSVYTAIHHEDEAPELVFVHGFDVAIGQSVLRGRIARNVEEQARALGLPLTQIETNIREIGDCYVDWGEQFHGAAIAAAALAAAPGAGHVYIAASNAYPDLSAWGSHPWIDPHYGTERTAMVYDGHEMTRFRKIEAIARDGRALGHLRVCHENRGGALNCGRCEKCLRTMVSLRTLGAQDRCAAFETPLRLWRVATFAPWKPWMRGFVEENLEALRSRGGDPKLEHALVDCLAERYNRGIWRAARIGARRLRSVLGAARRWRAGHKLAGT